MMIIIFRRWKNESLENKTGQVVAEDCDGWIVRIGHCSSNVPAWLSRIHVLREIVFSRYLPFFFLWQVEDETILSIVIVDP